MARVSNTAVPKVFMARTLSSAVPKVSAARVLSTAVPMVFMARARPAARKDSVLRISADLPCPRMIPSLRY